MHTHKPLCCELDSTIGASVGQAYYSSPEGVVSLLTGRHKYSSTSSPRVNGCPSGSNETYRPAWCRHTQYGHFHWKSKVTYRDGKNQRGQEAWHEYFASACLHGQKYIDLYAQSHPHTCNMHTDLPSSAPTQIYVDTFFFAKSD